MSNAALACQSLELLRDRLGVRELCVCPGGRNAPWVQILARDPSAFRVYSFFEERSAGFFALGRIRATGRPVAVLTTSGTAAGELLPAMMEAHYSGLPLVALTADRPRRFRGSGAPQAAEQVGLFGAYAAHCLDVEGAEPFRLPADLGLERPFQINVCFEEPGPDAPPPLSPRPDPAASELAQPRAASPQASLAPLSALLAECRSPIAIVGALAPAERPAARELLEALRIPAYFEGLSGLREDERLKDLRLHSADRLLDRGGRAGYPIDGVIRLGGVPTHRIWRDLEERASQLPVVSLSRLPFSGLARDSQLCVEPLETLASRAARTTYSPGLSPAALLEEDRERARGIDRLLQAEPQSEPGMIRRFSAALAPGSRLYLGNSLPIREWDLASAWSPRELEIAASRGLNGIDGQLSTFLGFAEPEAATNWALLGDLTALYDLAAPWALRQLPGVRPGIAVINNGGGKIFERMYRETEFQNRHELRFDGWARMWGLDYHLGRDVPEHLDVPGPGRVLELIPDAEATQRFWKGYGAL